MRLFLAIYPPKEYVKYFAEVYKKFDKQKRNLKPIPYDQVHLTLRFIGSNVTEDTCSKLIDTFKLYEGQYSKPSISIKNIKFGFERQRDPRHIIAKIENTPELLDLNNEVHGVIKSLKRKDTIRWKDKHSNEFHITIARMKDSATKSTGKQIQKLVLDAQSVNLPESFIPEKFELIESVIKPNSGPSYKRIAEFRL